MQFTAQHIATYIQGQIEGNETVEVSSFGKIEEAKTGQLSFLANPKYESYLYTTEASVVIVNEHLQLREAVQATLIRVPDAYAAFATLLDIYQKAIEQATQGIEQPSYIDPTAKLGSNIYIGAFAYIGKNAEIGNSVKVYPGVYVGNNVVIEENTVLFPGVKVYHNCKLGSNVIVHAGSIIGSDGFGFAPQPDGTYKKIPQTGNVVIEDHVEIGSNCTIDRATIGSTIIRSGAKIDNLVQIAHNVDIGSNSVIAAQAGISGSTKIGKQVRIGGQAGIVGHLVLGDGSQVNAQSGVTKNIPEKGAVTGSPAYDFNPMLRSQGAMRRLPELEKRVEMLEAIIHSIKNKQ